MPTIGCDEGTLFSSFSVAGGCGIASSCVGILFVIDVFTAINTLSHKIILTPSNKSNFCELQIANNANAWK